MFNKKLVLEDGTVLEGNFFGAEKDFVGELTFDISMFGQEKILADEKVKSKAVNFSYPLVGNYGVSKEDFEKLNLKAEAIVVKELCEKASNFQNDYSFEDLLKKNNIVGIQGIDTRYITKKIRKVREENKKLYGAIVDINKNNEEILKEILKIKEANNG
ncbi:MAG: hypothetical protein KGV57_03945 [Fusobacterium sp.]|nr:hypothetical protein [Fusobacterium sp.]